VVTNVFPGTPTLMRQNNLKAASTQAVTEPHPQASLRLMKIVLEHVLCSERDMLPCSLVDNY